MTIQSLENKKQQLLKDVNILSLLKKQLYSNMNIESPMSVEEKELNKKISYLFSEINIIVKQKRNLI